MNILTTGPKGERYSLTMQPFGNGRPDPLRRFVSTEYSTDIHPMKRTIRVESNDPQLLKMVEDFFPPNPPANRSPDVTWRIVVEADRKADVSGPISAFADAGVSFVNFGQNGFVSFDSDEKKGVAFLSRDFVYGSEARFVRRPPLDILFCMTMSQLGITSLSGAAVAYEGRCVLLFGEPDSGKSTTSYLASTLGLQFLSDQVVFLESHMGGVQVWGDPFPAVFRPATLQFHPELKDSLIESSYGDLSFYYFDRSHRHKNDGQSAAPICSVVLRRGTSRQPVLKLIEQSECFGCLREMMLFRDDARFNAQHDHVFCALEQHPSYQLDYDENPATAAKVIKSILVDGLPGEIR